MEAICSSETCFSTNNTALYQKPEVYTPALNLRATYKIFREGPDGIKKRAVNSTCSITAASMLGMSLFLTRDGVDLPLSRLYRRNVTDSLQVGPAFSDTQLLFSAESTSFLL